MTDYTSFSLSELKAATQGPNSEGVLRIVAMEALKRAEEAELLLQHEQRVNEGTFGWAVEMLKEGKRVAREGWNGKDMFLYLVRGSHFTVDREPLKSAIGQGTQVEYLPHIDMKTATGQCVPWLASQTDILAKDWEIA